MVAKFLEMFELTVKLWNKKDFDIEQLTKHETIDILQLVVELNTKQFEKWISIDDADSREIFPAKPTTKLQLFNALHESL